MELNPSTSASSVHACGVRPQTWAAQCTCHHEHASQHSSPRSAALPSPPASPTPSTDSLSSFPSVSSSFFFSSGAASPHHCDTHSHSGSHPHSESDHALIIPSLTLPSAVPQPTPYGQTLGEVNLIVIGPKGSGTTELTEFLLESDDVVDVCDWENVEGGYGRILRASTDWLEERDLHGLEKFEGTRNVSVLELDEFGVSEKPENVVDKVLQHVDEVTDDVKSQLDNSPSSPLLHSLLASSHSTLYIALIYVTATPLTPQDHAIIRALAPRIPVVPFSTTSSSTALSFSRKANDGVRLSSFQPRSHSALRVGVFRTPQTLATLRAEAADRFMRWREVERTVKVAEGDHFSNTERQRSATLEVNPERWSKGEWETILSEDYARRMRDPKTSTPDSITMLFVPGAPCFSPILDPLHFRSLMMLSLSLLSPRSRKSWATNLHTKERESARNLISNPNTDPILASPSASVPRWGILKWGFALVSVFCAGVGIGLALST